MTIDDLLTRAAVEPAGDVWSQLCGDVCHQGYFLIPILAGDIDLDCPECTLGFSTDLTGGAPASPADMPEVRVADRIGAP
ncbi:hypothetical protein [Actinoplanes sp. NPDC023714]|uniref:hypothetical protein n=1 Tax=Actinoplanes sp. NPDC023714 TaxID=3154322 RepID=UPI003401DC58